MAIFKPLIDLKDTTGICEYCQQHFEPIFFPRNGEPVLVIKNGEIAMVVMSVDVYKYRHQELMRLL